MKKLLFVSFFVLSVSVLAIAGDNDVQVKIIQNPDPSITEGESVGLVNASCDKMWQIMLDFDGIKNWMPNCTESYFRGKDSSGNYLAYLVVGMSVLGSKDMLNQYSTAEKPGIRKLSYKKIEGSWDYMEGYTILKDNGPASCKILAHSAARSGLSIPQALNISIAKDQLVKYIENLREYVKKQ